MNTPTSEWTIGTTMLTTAIINTTIKTTFPQDSSIVIGICTNRHLHDGVTHTHPHFPHAHHRHSHRATRDL